MSDSVTPLFTETQLAEKLDISVKTLRSWRYRGGGCPFLKLGAAVRYSWPDVERWLEDSRRNSTSDTGADLAA